MKAQITINATGGLTLTDAQGQEIVRIGSVDEDFIRSWECMMQGDDDLTGETRQVDIEPLFLTYKV